jgi:hypothetical protein
MAGSTPPRGGAHASQPPRAASPQQSGVAGKRGAAGECAFSVTLEQVDKARHMLALSGALGHTTAGAYNLLRQLKDGVGGGGRGSPPPSSQGVRQGGKPTHSHQAGMLETPASAKGVANTDA